MKFYFLAFAYLFIFFGSIYGLFVDELSIGLGSDSTFNYVLTGWAKNLTCALGLLIIGAASTYPLISTVHRALKIGNE